MSYSKVIKEIDKELFYIGNKIKSLKQKFTDLTIIRCDFMMESPSNVVPDINDDEIRDIMDGKWHKGYRKTLIAGEK